MSSVQYKKEKKLIEEKLQKVRQVVPTVSNNDIILALHNHDLNVERTIQAFLEEGAQGALGDWENTAKSKKSNKKKNNNASAKDNNSTTSSMVDSTTGTLKQQNGKSSSSTLSKTINGNNAFTNGYANGMTTSVSASSSSAAKSKQAPPKITTTSNLDNLGRLDFVEKSKVLSAELNGLNRHETDLTKVQNQFDFEIANAQISIAQCFKEIRQITDQREKQLLAALNHIHEEGRHYLSSRKAELHHLQSSSIGSSKNEDDIVKELKKFLANKQHDLELAEVTRFVYDNSKIINSISRFGEIISINGAAALQTPTIHSTPSQSHEIKHATSHSSLVSSVGEDSGLGQISPVANEKTNIVQVDNGGIKMQSNAISADQLAEIQRQLTEQLKAQGIDPSVLDGASSTVPPIRRRPQQNNHHHQNNNKRPGGGSNKKNLKPEINLSILQK